MAATKKANPVSAENWETQLCRYIFAGSGAMIGICTTLVGLVKIVEGRIGPSRVDEFVAVIALTFLGSAILSYLSLRSERAGLSRKLGRVADGIFLTGLFGIVILITLFAVERV